MVLYRFTAGKGRGLVLTGAVKKGDLLAACRPLAVASKHPIELAEDCCLGCLVHPTILSLLMPFCVSLLVRILTESAVFPYLLQDYHLEVNIALLGRLHICAEADWTIMQLKSTLSTQLSCLSINFCLLHHVMLSVLFEIYVQQCTYSVSAPFC